MAFGGYLKQGTAVDILLGPYLDKTDGNTAETGLTLDVELSKNGQALANKNDTTTPTDDTAGDIDGFYNCELDATDTNTLGMLTIIVHNAAALATRLDYQVVTSNWFDTMCSTDQFDVNITNVATDAIDADALKADAVTAIQSGLATPTNITAGTITTVTNNTDMVDYSTELAAIVADTEDIQTQIGTAGAGLSNIGTIATVTDITNDVTLANGAHGGAAASLTLASYTDFTGAAASNPNLLLDTTVASLTSQTVFVLTAGSDVADSYNGQAIVMYDASNSDFPSVRVISDYSATTREVTLDSAPDFTLVSSDVVKVFVTAPGSSAPTAGVVAAAVWDKPISEHTTATTFGGKNQKNVPSETIGDYKATGFATPTNITAGTITTVSGSVTGSVGSVAAAVTTDTASRTASKADVSALATSAALSTMQGNVTDILADTNELQTDDTPAALAAIDALIDSIIAKTNNLPADPAGTSDIPTTAENALALLKYNFDGITGEAARSTLNALRFLRNKWSITGTTLTITKEDDSTSAWTATVAGDAAADPIVSSDPA